MAKGDCFVFLDFAFNQVPAGRVIIKLFLDVAPKTAENFRCLCTGEKGMGQLGKLLYYKGSRMHRVVPLCMVQGGDIVNGDGTSGDSIYGEYFPSEAREVEHTEPGMVGLSIDSSGRNSSQFYITTQPCPHLDDQNVVCGKVVKGLDVIQDMSEIPRENDIPQGDIVICDCGELKPGEPWCLEENDGTADVYPPWPNDWNGSVDEHLLTGVIRDINGSGHIFYHKQSYQDAERKYKKVLRYIDWFIEKSSKRADNSFMEFRYNVLLNLCAVRLKLNKNAEVIQHSSEVIAHNPDNGKAFYRRACAKLALKEYDGALQDLKIAYKLHPNDRSIRNTFEAAKRKRQLYLNKEKLFYSRAFNNVH
ncbi:peptidyl-prolyl cis-trans isomerase D isoform X1 [Dendroctonus ponderosae]|uniref:peptidylprolyl isomerase n=1 Tax=Dendroctonus ponderosae TaxID=77166 RepID=J3JY09_DENPD|nr:peptidyl-prolyl cis-trans isomerase D isoform X1 [Dendroctonus ponderosae]AEE63093.1 unknown [Dendroctonus ponderosae]KAH1026728.1 hypothetical protein HUJ05_000350 [Dendroctonus ponderosae]